MKTLEGSGREGGGGGGRRGKGEGGEGGGHTGNPEPLVPPWERRLELFVLSGSDGPALEEAAISWTDGALPVSRVVGGPKQRKASHCL